MSLQNERGETTRRKWFSRFSRERRALSTSVEETMLDEHKTSQQDLLDAAASDEDIGSSQSSQHAKVISPHFTMQSSSIPLVRSLSSSQTSEDEAQKIANAKDSGNLAYFAPQSTLSQEVPSNDKQPEILPPASTTPQSSSHLAASAKSSFRIAGSGSVSEESQMLPAMNKANSRPTKVRLETAPMSAIELRENTTPRKAKQHNGVETLSHNNAHALRSRVTTSDMQSLDLSTHIPSAPGAESPFLDLYRLEARDSSMRLPAVTLSEEHKHAAKNRRSSLSGHGSLEAGQRAITLENSHITATSVVVVMMTSNPGPAVVHYVSLQPAVGFTVHLSSPVTAKTTFNYVVLRDELF